MDIKENRRTLAGFFPDAAARHQMHYQFAHGFLPFYAFSNAFAIFRTFEEPGMDATRWVQSRWSVHFLQAVGVKPRFGSMDFDMVTDLSASFGTLAERPALVVTMPPPEQTPEAYFVAILAAADPATLRNNSPEGVRVLTMERTELGDEPRDRAVLGEWTADRMHKNHGRLFPATREGLEQAAALLLGNTG